MPRGVCLEVGAGGELGTSCGQRMQVMQRLHAARTAGFHHGSIRKTCDAAVRLSATPPALRLIRNTRTLHATQHSTTAQRRMLSLSLSLVDMQCSIVMRDMLLAVTDHSVCNRPSHERIKKRPPPLKQTTRRPSGTCASVHP